MASSALQKKRHQNQQITDQLTGKNTEKEQTDQHAATQIPAGYSVTDALSKKQEQQSCGKQKPQCQQAEAW